MIVSLIPLFIFHGIVKMFGYSVRVVWNQSLCICLQECVQERKQGRIHNLHFLLALANMELLH